MVATDFLVAVIPLRLRFLGKLPVIRREDVIFDLHFRHTFIFLFAFSALTTCTQFFGEPIECIKGGDINERIINTFCWIEGTFTLPRALTIAIANEVAYPGIDKYVREQDEIITHRYYQWVPMVLFTQGCCFYITHIIWKHWEKGRLERIASELHKPILTKENKAKCEKDLIQYLYHSEGQNTSYAYKYAFLEVVNFLHVIIQIYATDHFLGGEFTTYGLQVFGLVTESDPLLRIDPMAKVFPKMTKCTFSTFGPSGSVQKYDNLCLLPLNIVNEKGFVILWFWFYFVAIASFLGILRRAILIMVPSTRWSVFSHFNRMVPKQCLDVIKKNCSYGDWFLLYLLNRNLDPLHYRDMIIQLSHDYSKNADLLEMESNKTV